MGAGSLDEIACTRPDSGIRIWKFLLQGKSGGGGRHLNKSCVKLSTGLCAWNEKMKAPWCLTAWRGVRRPGLHSPDARPVFQPCPIMTSPTQPSFDWTGTSRHSVANTGPEIISISSSPAPCCVRDLGRMIHSIGPKCAEYCFRSMCSLSEVLAAGNMDTKR